MVKHHLFTSESVAEGHPDFAIPPLGEGWSLSSLTDFYDTTRPYSTERKAELVERLRSSFGSQSQREMARRLGLGKTTVNRWMAEVGIKHQKFTCDECFFDTWTEESAYVLGYVFTDGNVQCDPVSSRWGLTITAAQRDLAHLERVRHLLGITKPLLYAESTRSYRMNIASKVLAEKLVDRGVFPRKSLSMDFPAVPLPFLKHFIRGVVDGDGSVFYFDRPRSPYFSIRIYSGSRLFLIGAQAAIRTETSIGSHPRRVHKNTYLLEYTCGRAETLGRWLYEGAGIFLARKQQAYLAMKEKRGVPYAS